ncbi:hypothetical protein A1D31_13560 [Bradyrhizobium liaoningense]|nr:hypothetical protein A1D31_13560 [Bradyrhizobium liaoningense]
MLVLAFLCGVALLLDRTRIAFSHRLLLLSFVGFVASVLASNRNREDLAALFVSYLTVYLGLLNFNVGLVARRPIAHGIYLTYLPFKERPFFSLGSNVSDRVDDSQW